MKKEIKINDLPNTCYAVQPIYKGELTRGFNTPVILIHKGETGYYKTDITVNSIDNLMEINKQDFNITDINIVQILQDYSVFGHYGLLNIINENNNNK